MSKDRKSDGYYASGRDDVEDIPLTEQIAAVRLAATVHRDRDYPEMVAAGRLRQANRQAVRLLAALETLEVYRLGRGS